MWPSATASISFSVSAVNGQVRATKSACGSTVLSRTSRARVGICISDAGTRRMPITRMSNATASYASRLPICRSDDQQRLAAELVLTLREVAGRTASDPLASLSRASGSQRARASTETYPGAYGRAVLAFIGRWRRYGHHWSGGFFPPKAPEHAVAGGLPSVPDGERRRFWWLRQWQNFSRQCDSLVHSAGWRELPGRVRTAIWTYRHLSRIPDGCHSILLERAKQASIIPTTILPDPIEARARVTPRRLRSAKAILHRAKKLLEAMRSRPQR